MSAMFQSSSLHRRLLPLLLLSLLCAPARAGIAVYTDRAAFDAAVMAETPLYFDGILPPGTSFANYTSLTVGGDTFSTPSAGADVNVTTAAYYPAQPYAHDFIVNSYNPGVDNVLQVATAPVRAFGLDYGTAGNGGTTVTIVAASGAQSLSFTDAAAPGLGSTRFVGFIADAALTQVTVTAVQDAWLVEDVVHAVPVPEPAAGVLLAACGLGLVAARRLRGG